MDKIFGKPKRSEITSEQIVVVIVLLVSFAILLFFIIKLNLQDTTDKEICHNSVVNRGKIADIASPLKCSTEYLCITQDGSCEGMTNPKIEEVGTKEEIFSVLADNMYDCWWMFGEGKINYVGKDFTENLYCSICSQIYFDNSIKTIVGLENGQLDKIEIYDYLANTNIPNKKITYSEYLYKTNDISKIKNELKNQNVEFGTINLDNQQYIIMGITSKISNLKFIAVGGIAGIVALPIAGIPTTLVALGIAGTSGGVAGHLFGLVVEGLSGNEYLSPSIVEVNSDEFKKLECKNIETYA